MGETCEMNFPEVYFCRFLSDSTNGIAEVSIQFSYIKLAYIFGGLYLLLRNENVIDVYFGEKLWKMKFSNVLRDRLMSNPIEDRRFNFDCHAAVKRRTPAIGSGGNRIRNSIGEKLIHDVLY